VLYQTVVSPGSPLLPHGAPPSEPSQLEDHFSPLHLPAMVSPIRVDRLELELRSHPHQATVAYVISGLHNGFHLGFHSSSNSLKSATSNMPSALLQRSIIDSYLHNELHKGRIAGPFPIRSFGAATTAAQQGLPDHLIKTMGCWSSDAYLLYVRTPVQSILNVSGQLL